MERTEQSTCINIERLFSKQSPPQQKYGIELPKYLFSILSFTIEHQTSNYCLVENLVGEMVNTVRVDTTTDKTT